MSRPSPSRCPICREPAGLQYRPFCSKRCADVDLNRWLKGSYAIPAVEEDADSEDMDNEREGGPTENTRR